MRYFLLIFSFLTLLGGEDTPYNPSWSFEKKAAYFNLEKVTDFIKEDKDIAHKDADGISGYDMLNFSIYAGNLEVVRYLIEHGADVNYQDSDGISPLIDAILGEKPEIIAYLLDHGADVNLLSKEGQSPLMYAQATQDLATTKLLIEHKANVDHKDSLDQTALILASRQGNLPIVKYLVAQNASIDFDEKMILHSYNWVSNENRDKVINYLRALKISRSIKAPTLKFVDTPKSVKTERTMIKLKITDEGSGIGAVHLFINGSEVFANEQRALKRKKSDLPKDEKPFVIKSYNIAVQQGLNEIKAYVYDGNNTMQSEDLHFSMIGDYVFDGKPTLHAIVIGINEFQDKTLDLSYAAADATLFGTTLFKRAKDIFKHVNIHYLRERDITTKEAITKTLSRLENISANDFFVFYTATHGIILDQTFYMITSNVANTDEATIKKDALSQDDLRELFKHIPTANKLLIFDTCYSGLINEKIAKKLAETTVGKLNLTSISAATSKQTALEGYADGHGVFSYVLSEALEGEADYNGDGMIQSMELVQYAKTEVPIAAKTYNHEQFPAYFQSGQIFPVTKLRDYKGKINLKPQYFKFEEIKEIAQAMEKKDAKAINEVVKQNIEKTVKKVEIVKKEAIKEKIEEEKAKEPKKVEVGEFKFKFGVDKIILPTTDKLLKHFQFTNAKGEHLLVLDFDSIYFKKHMISEIKSPSVLKVKVGWHDVSYRITLQLKSKVKYTLKQTKEAVEIEFK